MTLTYIDLKKMAANGKPSCFTPIELKLVCGKAYRLRDRPGSLTSRSCQGKDSDWPDFFCVQSLRRIRESQRAETSSGRL